MPMRHSKFPGGGGGGSNGNDHNNNDSSSSTSTSEYFNEGDKHMDANHNNNNTHQQQLNHQQLNHQNMSGSIHYHSPYENTTTTNHQIVTSSSPSNASNDRRQTNNQQLLAERVQSSSCSAVATAGTPSSPRSIRSGISSVSHGMGFPMIPFQPNGSGGALSGGTHANSNNNVGLNNTLTGGGGMNNSIGGNSDLSIQCSIPSGGPYSPPSRPLPLMKRPSSALSEGSVHSSTAVAIGDSLPRDDELTTIDDEEDELNLSHRGDTQSDDHHSMNLNGSDHHIHHHHEHQPTTPVHLTRAKNGEDTSSVMGGRKAFESSNYVENLDELGDFQVRVESPDFRFSCGHFVAYDGYRERLHGHTYTVKLRIGGRLNPDGYVVDFNLCKRIVRDICKKLNEYMIIPLRSDVLSIKNDDGSIHITTQDGAKFMFPESDCLCLPIMHSTAEELAAYFWNEALQTFSPQYLQNRGVRWLEICVAERPTQEAQYRRHIPVPPPL